MKTIQLSAYSLSVFNDSFQTFSHLEQKLWNSRKIHAAKNPCFTVIGSVTSDHAKRYVQYVDETSQEMSSAGVQIILFNRDEKQ